MQFKTNLIEIEINPLGVIRWLGKYFTKYEVPADTVLLSNEDYETNLYLKKTLSITPVLKDKHNEL